jgi:allantoin racemase
MLEELKLADHCESIRSIDAQPDNQGLMRGREEYFFPRLARAAQSCVDEDGADVILLGSTTMHQCHAYVSERLDVPVINPGPLTNKLAEMVLGLGLSHSK